MKKKWKRTLILNIVGIALITGFMEQPARAGEKLEEDTVYSFGTGPGYPVVPFRDPYVEYQWALLNTGILKLIPNRKNTAEEKALAWLKNDKLNNPDNGPSKDGDNTVISVGGIDINIVPAWEKYNAKPDKRQVVVALIDSGVDYNHEDLKNSVWINQGEIPGDGIDNDGNGYIDDVYGWNFYSDNNQVYTGADDNHGTHSAGTIAAARNGKGIVGINDSDYVKVMPVKVLGTATGVGSAENVAKAIRYAEANGASICNLSFGTAKYNEELYETIKNSRMLFIVAAGNGDPSGTGYNIDSLPIYPASFQLDNIISVANLRLDGALDPASNYGKRSVDLAAPGNYILSTIINNHYGYMSGTSMAAPMVTGVAAMLYSYDPSLQITEIKGKILSTVKKLDGLTEKTATGGILDAAAALDAL